jgi:two-component system response regulator NreC
LNATKPSKRFRVLLADDHKVVLQGFRLLLSREPDIEVVGDAFTGSDAVALATELEPDVVVLDIAMPDINGVEVTRRILRDVPQTKVMILTMHKDAVYVREALRAGARGYVLKESIDVELAAAVRAVGRGQAYLSPSVSATVLDGYQQQVTDPLDQITNRERQVLQLLAEGKTSKDVAVELNISVYTVDAHRSRIMKKLQLRTGRDLVRFALQRGLI